jgi:membrane protein
MILAFAKDIYQIWITERPTQLAAALAYYGIFSIAPVIFIAFTIAGIFIDNLALADQVSTQLNQVLGSEVVQALQQMIATTSVSLPDSYAGWSWLPSLISFLALFWAASGLFTQIHFALNKLWQVPNAPKSKPHGMFRQRLLSFSMVILLGLLLVLVSFVNILISWADSIFDLPTDYAAVGYLAFIGLTALTFGLIYKYIPNVNLRWRDVWLGAFIAALLETIGVLLIGLFLQFGAFGSASAAAGSFAILLVIMYYMAQIFLFGVVITRVFTLKYGSQSHSPENG